MKEQFAAVLGAEGVRENEPMRDHTTFAVGGPADYMLFPETNDALAQAIALCKKNALPWMILGCGSNMLVSDAGIRGVVISTERLQTFTIEDNLVTAAAGLTLADVCKRVAEAGLSGLEFACGIPGSIGGAIYMDAGAYGGEMRDVVHDVTVLDAEGNILVVPAAEMDFSYRHSRLQDEEMTCLSARFALKARAVADIEADMAELTERRESRQPIELPSAGSTFKRPEGHYAGPLIIEAGMQGHTVGGAQVSTKHAGFVVNIDHATANDVITLIHEIQQAVLKNSGVQLETEVRFVGDWTEHPLYHAIAKAE